MKTIQSIDNGWILVEDGKILSLGEMNDCPEQADKVVSLEGQFVLPCFIDSHTHTVFQGYREHEFIDKIKGMTYEEIASKGGGILQSAKRLQFATEEELFDQAYERISRLIAQGTGGIEIKSGYGLNLAAEEKMLRVIRRLKERLPIPVKASFLGAHAYPDEFKNNHQGYVKELIEHMIPTFSGEGLADYIDVFCERGFFTEEDTNRILEQGMKYGLKAKIHANQLSNSGGVQVGVKNRALSVDHLEVIGDEEIELLGGSETCATLLPGCSFFIRIPYAPARRLIDANAIVSLASDYNPGSAPSGNMQFIFSLACIHLRMLPEEAIHAMTINAAYAMELQSSHGSISPGKQANFIITKPVSSLAYLPYAFSTNHIDSVYINGSKY